jgi:hypothetical protein
MARDLVRTLTSNKQLRELEFIQADGGGRRREFIRYQTKGERRVALNENLSVKQLQYE